MDINQDLSTVETILKKKAANLTEEDKKILAQYQSDYAPIVTQLSHDVTQATKIVGKKEEATVDDMLKTIAMTRKLIHKSRALVKEVTLSTAFDCRKIKQRMNITRRRRRRVCSIRMYASVRSDEYRTRLLSTFSSTCRDSV